MGNQDRYSLLLFYDEEANRLKPFEDPNLIYPGQKVYVPLSDQYNVETAENLVK